MSDTQQTSDEQDSNESEKRRKKFAPKDEITEENCKFEEGQILQFTRVRFPGHAHSYAFLVGQRNIMYGQKVMAMSDRGMAVGYINSFQYELPFKKDMLPLRSINKIANEQDIEKEKENYKRQKEIETICQNLIEKHKLDMNLTHVEFTQFGKKVVFYFVAPSRVDFRGLVKDLVSELKLRIELRQISVRDRAASMGALGPCGRELCCSSFLSKYGNVSIKMAKNQNLSLNYSKLNGVCGQLKCCLSYEEDVYSEKRKKLPNEGELIQTRNGDNGKVTKLNILHEQFDMLTDKGKIRRFTFNQVAKKHSKDDSYNFPKNFDNISDDTGVVNGLDYLETQREKQMKRDLEKIEKRAKKYALERLMEISDFLPEKEPGERERMLKELEEQSSAKKEEQEEKEEAFVNLEAQTQQIKEQSSETESKNTTDRPHKKHKKFHKNRPRRNRNNNKKS